MSAVFESSAREIFDPIANKHHMTCTEAAASSVQYDNGVVGLLIVYDRGRSYELGVTLSFAPDALIGHPNYDLAEILRMKKIEGGSFSVANAEELPSFLRRLADMLEKNASEFLNGIPEAFVQLYRFRVSESRRSASAENLSSARARAEAAWQDKDYGSVVQALEPIQSQLTAAEKKKLDYARNQP